jgi:hypothetical protein
MSKLSKRRPAGQVEIRAFAGMHQIQPNVAGVDIGTHEIRACIPGLENTRLVSKLFLSLFRAASLFYRQPIVIFTQPAGGISKEMGRWGVFVLPFSRGTACFCQQNARITPFLFLGTRCWVRFDRSILMPLEFRQALKLGNDR